MQEKPMSANDDQVREYAHHLWEAEGKPEGQAERHWLEALSHFDQQKYPHHKASKKK